MSKRRDGLTLRAETKEKTTEKHSGLGRGLGALLGGDITQYRDTAAASMEGRNAGVQEISIKLIVANPFQPRREFNREKMEELINSVKEHGILQPLLVRKKDGHYELAAGERRLRAARAAGLDSVPVLVNDYDDESMREVALVENIQRHNLNPIEEAEGIRALMLDGKLTQEQAAKKIGRSRVAVANILRLLNLPENIRRAVAEERITMGQVRPVLTLGDAKVQTLLAQTIMEEGLSARMVEAAARLIKDGAGYSEALKAAKAELTGKMAKPAEKKAASAIKLSQELELHYRAFQDSLVALLGTRVRVVAKNAKRGRIEIEYCSEEELQRIYDILQNKAQPAMEKAPGRVKKFMV